MRIYYIRERDGIGHWVRRPYIIWCVTSEAY